MTDYECGLIIGVVLGIRIACVVFGRNFSREMGLT